MIVEENAKATSGAIGYFAMPAGMKISPRR